MVISSELIAKLNQLFLKYPASIDSLTRTPAHNASVGGAPQSGHVTGEAADLLYDSPALLHQAAIAAIQLGFTGVELDLTNNHLHVDVMARTWHVVHTVHGDMPLGADGAPTMT